MGDESNDEEIHKLRTKNSFLQEKNFWIDRITMNKYKQVSLDGNKGFPSFEEIVIDYSKEFYNYITPKGDNIFGFWMQTLADLELLKLELEGLTNKFKINATERNVWS